MPRMVKITILYETRASLLQIKTVYCFARSLSLRTHLTYARIIELCEDKQCISIAMTESTNKIFIFRNAFSFTSCFV